jgi:hypothetical protein
MWTIYPKADRDEVEDLVTRLAAELGIDKPPLQDTTVALPPDGAPRPRGTRPGRTPLA